MPSDNPQTPLQAIDRRAQELARRRLAVQVRRENNEKQRQKLLSQALAAQARLDASESVKAILEDIQHQSHERAVGAYEQMLSALLADVLPGQRDVVLDLHAERGAPAMDVFIRKGDDAPLEDAWLGTGGSVTNLLSTGLRLVALMRSGRRRFLVLDESDCWIKPSLVEKYAAVVAQMARELGVQVLMVSHHDESLFAAHVPYRLRMARVGSTTTVEWTPGSEVPAWNMEDDGIRSIGLFDFQAHKNTIVPLAPGVTLLQGDNDIGKSAVVNALRAIFDGVSNDTMIRHHASKARVEIDLGQQLLTWSRNRKGSVKVTYDLIDTATRTTLHASTGTKVPDWLTEEIGIGKVDDLDVQIGQQQEPVFLLNQPASRRAKALAVGQESGHIQAMMVLDRQEQQAARALLRQCEDEIERLRQEEVASRGVEQQPGPDNTIVAQVRDRAMQLEKMRQLAQAWNKAHRIVEVGALSTVPPQSPTLHGNDGRKLLDRWKHSQLEQTARAPITRLPHPQAPTLHGTAVRGLWARWKRLVAESIPLVALRKQDAPQAGLVPKSGPARQLLVTWNQAEARTWARYPLREHEAPQAPVTAPRPAQALLAAWQPLSARLAILSTLRERKAPQPPERSDNLVVRQQRDYWRAAHRNATLHEQAITQAKKEESQAAQELDDTFPRCPTCGQDLPHALHPLS